MTLIIELFSAVIAFCNGIVENLRQHVPMLSAESVGPAGSTPFVFVFLLVLGAVFSPFVNRVLPGFIKKIDIIRWNYYYFKRITWPRWTGRIYSIPIILHWLYTGDRDRIHFYGTQILFSLLDAYLISRGLPPNVDFTPRSLLFVIFLWKSSYAYRQLYYRVHVNDGNAGIALLNLHDDGGERARDPTWRVDPHLNLSAHSAEVSCGYGGACD
jgi:hypothetical protein